MNCNKAKVGYYYEIPLNVINQRQYYVVNYLNNENL